MSTLITTTRQASLAIKRLRRRGLLASEIARKLGITTQQVWDVEGFGEFYLKAAVANKQHNQQGRQ